MMSRRNRTVHLLIGWILLILFLGVNGESCAQEKSFLWKVQSDKNTVYLLGSIHFLKKENYPLNKAIEDAFQSSKQLVLEIDLETTRQEKAQRLMLQKGMSADGKTLRQAVSEETYGLAETQAKELGMDLRALSRFKPWFVALTISTLKLQKLGFDPSYGVDRYFSGRAKKEQKTISGLETFEHQIELFDQLSHQNQERMLLQTLKGMDMMEKELDRLVRAWASGDGESLQKILLESFREYPEVYKKLISDRNRLWLPDIEGFLRRGETAMIVVGAGHLIGEGGLVELLKKRGYAVEQL